MSSVFDVAGYILKNTEDLTAWQLQKLCYYSKAWSLALNDDPMFPEKFGAWKNGPVCRPLYYKHKGRLNIPKNMFECIDGNLNSSEKAIILAVIDKYGSITGDDLSEKTHCEMPWKVARSGVPEDQNSNRNLNEEIIRDYYRIQKEDYKEMEDRMLYYLAKERESDVRETVSLKEVMTLLDITL